MYVYSTLKKIPCTLKTPVLDFSPLLSKKELKIDLLHQSEWTFFTLKPKCKLNWITEQAIHRSATKSSGSPIPWPFFPHSPQIWARAKFTTFLHFLKRNFTFLRREQICCRTPGDWLLRLYVMKNWIHCISSVETISVLRLLSQSKPNVSMRT